MREGKMNNDFMRERLRKRERERMSKRKKKNKRKERRLREGDREEKKRRKWERKKKDGEWKWMIEKENLWKLKSLDWRGEKYNQGTDGVDELEEVLVFTWDQSKSAKLLRWLSQSYLWSPETLPSPLCCQKAKETSHIVLLTPIQISRLLSSRSVQ